MQVVILAAGLGTRLGKDLPKCLVQIEGISILENIIRTIAKIDRTAEFIIVTGFKHELVEIEVKKIQETFHSFIQTVQNANVQEYSIVKSLALTAPHVSQESVLRISGDIFFSQQNTLKALIQEQQTCLAIQQPPPSRDETPIVNFTLNSELLEIVLDQPSIYEWEWSDIEIYRQYDFQKMLSYSEKYQSLGYHHLDLINQCLLTGMKIKVRGITGTFEIDTPRDFEYAKQIYNSNS